MIGPTGLPDFDFDEVVAAVVRQVDRLVRLFDAVQVTRVTVPPAPVCGL